MAQDEDRVQAPLAPQMPRRIHPRGRDVPALKDPRPAAPRRQPPPLTLFDVEDEINGINTHAANDMRGLGENNDAVAAALVCHLRQELQALTPAGAGHFAPICRALAGLVRGRPERRALVVQKDALDLVGAAFQACRQFMLTRDQVDAVAELLPELVDSPPLALAQVPLLRVLVASAVALDAHDEVQAKVVAVVLQVLQWLEVSDQLGAYGAQNCDVARVWLAELTAQGKPAAERLWALLDRAHAQAWDA